MTSPSGRLYDFLLTLQQKPVLVIGDVMLDRYVQGEVDRLSPEAPIPILSEKHTSMTTGGAANVARNLAQLGANVSLIGLIGSDNAGRELSKAIAEVPQILFAPILCPDRPTTVKTRYLSSGQQMLRVDSEVTTKLNEDESAKLIEQATIMMADCEILILSDYAKGCFSPDVTSQLIHAAHEHGIKVIIDPKSVDFRDYRGADFLTPNLAELKKATGITEDSLDAIEAAARQVLERCEINQMLVTLSARGMMTVSKEEAHHIPSRPCEVFDVSGAGDTVIALLASGLLMGLDELEAATVANIGASLVVAKSGTACLAPGEILAQSYGASTATPLYEVKQNISKWRQQGQKIGFTNGCFDLLHAGHIHILKQCAADCDRLIVGLNADSSVKRLKGSDRPVQSEDVRGAVLANLPFVDAVVLFEEDTPKQLIEALVPDCLSKGGDYQIEHIVGADIVRAAGGIVRAIPLLEGHSTTRFLNLSAVKAR
ncbi:MAG: bifunctional heptose 7-phosphate kinase/heptose 1-phosphate adenyltransferase [Alphaproteobacteria bacterium]|nr:bifunctional heptose 7-phosphate kinase/heptose 1-phosphate adenyltransferase [Alphaproteobacteria bacterium]MBL6776553.1 bifunctional heptose 7-phosphate kinase/heptose 1-phosphate adenyltransferase [Alphaproteobacteria bacterium]